MAQELLASDVDALFENKNLEEVQLVLRKMRLEVEKKREELRVTVGSRYRDLIEAADTISDMKNTSEEVIEHLVTVKDLLSSLRHRQLLGFQTDFHSLDKHKEIVEAKREYKALAAQVRLLMELPEIIWKQLEKGNYCEATQIQQFGFHLHTGLSVGSGRDVQKWFPVVNRQKVTLTSFNEIILKESTNQLKSVNLTLEKASDSGCALILLRGGDATQMLSDFLRYRTEAMKSISASQGSVKHQLQCYIQFLISSFTALHALFVEGFPESWLPQGMLSENLKNVSHSSASPTVQLLPLASEILIKHLPPIITEFRPSLKETWTPLPLSAVRSECQKWFESIRLWIPQEVHRLLGCVDHIKTLANLRDTAFSTLQVEPYANNWSELTQRLLGRSVSLWGELFQPTIMERIESVIQNHLDDGLVTMQQSIQQHCGKFDLKPWLWTETSSDLPSSVIATSKTSGIFMKSRCFTPSIQQLCSQWDHKLALLREDLMYYQKNELYNRGNLLPFDKLEMQAKIYSALEIRCVESIHKLVAFLNEEIELSENRVVFAMKLVTALIDLSPQLNQCIDNSQKGESKSWNAVTEFLRISAMEFFNIWKKDVLARMEQALKIQLKMKTMVDALQTSPLWDEITIQEEREDGDAVQSQIRVPMNPSFPLQQLLFKVCQEINQIGPHALPKKAQLSLMDDVCNAVLKCYENHIVSHVSVLPQPLALQLLFDVRFVCALLLARDNKTQGERAKNLMESLEGQVDPFDLDVFNPHLQTHVKRAVQRLQFVFSPLLTCDRHAILWAARLASSGGNAASIGSGQTETPSVVALVSSTSRFLPLPLTNNKNLLDSNTSIKLNEYKEVAATTQVKYNKLKSTSDASATNAAAMARSSAAAFFGAMSSTWNSSIFGGEK